MAGQKARRRDRTAPASLVLEGGQASDIRLRRRRQRQVQLIRRFGVRVFFELLDELNRNFELDDLDARLERYAALDPDLLRALQADRFPHLRLRLIARDRR